MKNVLCNMCTKIKGTYAIVSLMVNTALLKYEGVLYPFESNAEVDTTTVSALDNTTSPLDFAFKTSHIETSTITSTSNGFLSNDIIEAKIILATSISLVSGIFLVNSKLCFLI